MREQILKLCDETLSKVLTIYQVGHVVGLGRYAEQRAKKVVENYGFEGVKVHFLIHPSPASPAANSGWNTLAMKALEQADTDLLKYIRGEEIDTMTVDANTVTNNEN